MDRGEGLTVAIVYRRRIKKGRGQIGFSIGSCMAWNSEEARQTKGNRLPKKEDPELMSLRTLREALCSYAGPMGRNCAKCAICNYGRQWTRRTRDDTQRGNGGGDGIPEPARMDAQAVR